MGARICLIFPRRLYTALHGCTSHPGAPFWRNCLLSRVLHVEREYDTLDGVTIYTDTLGGML
jgi:hypothetical protein